MLIETTKALYDKLKSINNGYGIDFKVNVLAAEQYREIIANEDRKKRVSYPIIVIYDVGELEYDVRRYENGEIQHGYRMVEDNGVIKYYSLLYEPLLPYNLNYRIETVCNNRVQLNAILLWITRNIPDRYYLPVYYDDETYGKCMYEALYKRGNIVNADEETSSTLYRRTFELKITTLIENVHTRDVIQVGGVKINELFRIFERSEADGN